MLTTLTVVVNTTYILSRVGIACQVSSVKDQGKKQNTPCKQNLYVFSKNITMILLRQKCFTIVYNRTSFSTFTSETRLDSILRRLSEIDTATICDADKSLKNEKDYAGIRLMLSLRELRLYHCVLLR